MSGNIVEQTEWDEIAARIKADEHLVQKLASRRVKSSNVELLQVMINTLDGLITRWTAERQIRPVIVFRRRVRLERDLLAARIKKINTDNSRRATAQKRQRAANAAILALVDNGVLTALAKQVSRLATVDIEIEKRREIAVTGAQEILKQRAAIAEAANLDNGMDFIKALDGPREDSNG